METLNPEESPAGVYEVLVNLLQEVAFARNLTEVSIAAGIALEALKLMA